MEKKGVELNRNTFASWVVRSSRWFEPVCERLHDTLLQGVLSMQLRVSGAEGRWTCSNAEISDVGILFLAKARKSSFLKELSLVNEGLFYVTCRNCRFNPSMIFVETVVVGSGVCKSGCYRLSCH